MDLQATDLPASWHVVPIESGSKHPGSIVGKNWQQKTTNDPDKIRGYLDAGNNLGLLLGPKSGVIDLEGDTPEGNEILETLLGGIETPTYTSAKSKHWLFAYDERFVNEKSKVAIAGTEWRFGQDSAQSVIPPSVHETGVIYEWQKTPEVQLAMLPDAAWSWFEKHREKETIRPPKVNPIQYEHEDTIVNRGRDHAEWNYQWDKLLTSKGWRLVRNRGVAQDWCRPGKKFGTSATLNYDGSGTLRVFTSSTELICESSYDKFAFICCLEHGNNPMACAIAILPEEKKKMDNPIPDIDRIINGFEHGNDGEDDEEFCESMIPKSGLIREIYEFYGEVAYRKSNVMGIAVAVSLCQTLFGRRIRSHTDMRTNDYNLILATTGSGKEACEATITKILNAADPSGSHLYPPDIQSGNGLMKAISLNPCGVWVCDEFGKILQAVLDKKGNQHIKNIGNHLLKLYGKSNGHYGGAAHSDGVRNQVCEPHLVVLGLATGSTVFNCISSENVQDGLLGRIAFWPVQTRPKARREMSISKPSEHLSNTVSNWIKFAPGEGNLSSFHHAAITVQMSAEAKLRWNEHATAIDEQMDAESEGRAAIWARVAARTMKLALVHRAARMETSPADSHWDFIQIELQDVVWAIRMSNWLARIACLLVSENTVDSTLMKAKEILNRATAVGEVASRDLCRKFRGISSGDFRAAALELDLEVRTITGRGIPRVFYSRKAV